MELVGQVELNATAEVIWSALFDPAVLQRCFPGCKSVERKSQSEYAAVLQVKVGPLNAGFNGLITLTGTGRELMAGATAELARLGYTDAILWVLDTNDRARRFYVLAGWAEDGASKTDASRGFDITEVRYRTMLARGA